MSLLDNINGSSLELPVVRQVSRIVRLPEVKAMTGLSRTTLYDRMKDGLFPHSLSLGGRAVGWLEDDITRWIAARVAEGRRECG